MTIDYQTCVEGSYVLYDSEMNILSETNNLITDWGMNRLVGDRSSSAFDQPSDMDLSQRAFCYNITEIVLGQGTTGPTVSDWKLESMVPLSSYVETNERSTTGTELSSNGGGDLLITFTKLTRFKFESSFIGASQYNINEVGCSWSPTFSANNRYGIFSRAILPSTVTVTPGSLIFAKYVLKVKTNAAKVLGTMNHRTGSGATAFPQNKTNVRVLPFYLLKDDGTASHQLNNGIASGITGSGGYQTQSLALYDNNISVSLHVVTELVPPIFEDPGLHNRAYVSRGRNHYLDEGGSDNTLGQSFRRLWWLQMYSSDFVQTGSLSATDKGAYPLERYNTFTSTTTANIGHGNINVNNNASNHGIYAALSPSTHDSGASDYSNVIYENLNLLKATPNLYGRKNAESVELAKINGNSWKRSIKFLFSPGEFKQKTTVLKLYSATLEDWNDTHDGWVNYDLTGEHNFGVLTVFDSEYNPNPSHYIGFEYTFTFTRGLV